LNLGGAALSNGDRAAFKLRRAAPSLELAGKRGQSVLSGLLAALWTIDRIVMIVRAG